MKAAARIMYSMTEGINNGYLAKINSSGDPVDLRHLPIAANFISSHSSPPPMWRHR